RRVPASPRSWALSPPRRRHPRRPQRSGDQPMRPDVRRSIVCVTAVGLTAILSNVLDADAGTKQLPSYASYQNRPSVDLKGMFRDFEPRAFGGHPDFGVPAAAGAGRYADIPADELDSEGKPVFRTTGLKIASPAMDVEGRPIIG